MFLKKAFCMVGTSPESRTKTVISEKKKAADRMNRIPFVRLAAGAGEAPAGAFLSGVFDCIYLPRQNTDQVVYNVLCPRNYNAGFEKRIPQNRDSRLTGIIRSDTVDMLTV